MEASDDQVRAAWEIPMHQSLSQPILMGGVPRTFAIINWTTAAAIALGLQVFWLGIPMGVVFHTAAYYLTKKDPQWFDVFKRHLRHPKYFRST